MMEDMEENKVPAAMKIIVEALKRDEGYRHTWVANIAMAILDSDNSYKSLHQIANEGAERFLENLCRGIE